MALSDKDKRTLTIGGGVVAVLVVGFLLFNLLAGGGGETASSRTPRPTSTSGSGPDTSVSPTLAPSPVLVLPARDPFSTPPGFSTTSSSSSSGSSSSSSSGSSSSSSTSTSVPPGPGGNASQTIGGHTVTLLDTFTANGVEQAQVEVDGTVYDPAVGDDFGPNDQYRLQSVSGNCATFLYGDESFTLCVAQNK